ncbi:MAG: hypothetical protein E7042_04630 [Lentisphaerae bacterium]|nr:hypothetical protein [Lentisphaerota bacterium]
MTKFFAFIGFGVTVAIAIWALSQCSFNIPGISKLFSGSAMTSATLREPGKLLGDNRAPHHELSAGEAALKNCISFVLYDWEAYSETLPPEEAAKWKNKKLSPQLQETRKQNLAANHQYTVSSSEIKDGNASIIIAENINGDITEYQVSLKKNTSGWLVTAFEQLKK